MAGSSLSPRQKLINMMYLVLTALLALNVSAEILQAFESLRASLKETAGAHGAQNETLATDILSAIETQEKSNNHKYSYLKPSITEINNQAAQVVAYIESVNAELEEIAHKDPITGELKRKDETNRNYAFWLGSDDAGNGGHGNGKAVELRQKLEEFHAWANALYAKQDDKTHEPNHFPKLILEPSADPNITDAESRKKTWEYFSFHEKPVVADLAMMEKFKMDVRDIQSGLLHQTKEIVKGFVYTIDSLIPLEAPFAQSVAAGMKYETRLSVGIASSSIKPEFVGPNVRTDPGGSTATMSLTANGSVIPDGQSEGIQNYSAVVKVPKADGTFQNMTLHGKFTVRRPEVVVRSRALQILYRDCGNVVEVDVPALGDSYDPDFSRSKGGNILRSKNSKKDITIVPTGGNFDLSIYSNTNGQSVKIDNLKYNVVKPAAPRLAIYASGQELMSSQAVSKKQQVVVKLIPEAEFARTLPNDARYRATKVKLMLQDGIVAPKEITSVSGADIQKGVKLDLYQGDIRNTYPGARIYIEVEGVQRVNFQNRAVDENLPRNQSILSALIKN
jgi:gliding motility-associated protein GldM